MRLYCCTIILAAFATAALAQDEPVIIVTAPGGTVDADEVESIDAAAIILGPRADLSGALARQVPGLAIAEAQGNPWQAAITWRGYGVSALQGTEQGMAVYLDGVRFNQPFGDTLTLDLLPESMLAAAQLREASPVYGRNALGGAILLQTANGHDRPGMKASLTGDSFGGYGGTASWGTAHSLIAIEAQHDEGWRDDSPSRLLRAFGSFDFGGEGWNVEAKLIGADTQLYGNGVAPVELLEADYRAVFTKPDITESTFGRATLIPTLEVGPTSRLQAVLHYQALARDSSNGDLAEFGPCDADNTILCVGEEDEGFEEILRDSRAGTAVEADPDIDDYAVYNRGRERTSGGGIGLQFLEEHETERGELKLALGAVYDEYRTNFAALSELGELLEDRSVDALGTQLVSDDGGITPVSVTSKLRDIAVFASADVPLAHWLSAEVGLRWSYNRVQLVDRIGTALDGTHAFRRLSPSFEVDVEPQEGLTFSLGVSETSRNPTPAELSCADPEAPCALANFFVADPPLDPVSALNWHADARYGAGALSLKAGIWRSDSKNDIRHIASDIRGRAYFANLGRSRRQGFDIGADWKSGPWELGADYAFTDARFRSEFAISSPANPEASEEGEILVQRGDRLPNLPRHSGNIRLAYDTGSWGLAGFARLRSEQVLVGDEGNDNPPLPGYAIFDVVGHVQLLDRLSLVLEVRNLFDREYATFGTFSEVDEVFLSEAPDAEDPRAYAPGMPRRVSAALKFRF
jgi:outer membrane receptor protein involved in Fe transport